jgi:hypothetical protein
MSRSGRLGYRMWPYTGPLFYAIGRNLDLGTLCEDGPDEWSPGGLPWYGSANVFITLVWTWSTEYFLLQTVLIAIGLRFQGARKRQLVMFRELWPNSPLYYWWSHLYQTMMAPCVSVRGPPSDCSDAPTKAFGRIRAG